MVSVVQKYLRIDRRSQKTELTSHFSNRILGQVNPTENAASGSDDILTGVDEWSYGGAGDVI